MGDRSVPKQSARFYSFFYSATPYWGTPGGTDRYVLVTKPQFSATIWYEAVRAGTLTISLTTLRARHATITSGSVHLRFTGKHGKLHTVSCADPRLARVAKRCQELPGQQLFQYLADDDEPRPVRSSDVNDYLREVTGIDATAKTFRTWEGSVQAAELLAATDVPSSERGRQRVLKEAIGEVAACLNNTITVCRTSYVHPRIVERWERDELADLWDAGPSRAKGGVDSTERRLLHVLAADLPRRGRRAA